MESEAKVFACDKKSGWTILMRQLSDYNFDRLNHDIFGVPIYFNKNRVWPKAADGIEVIWNAEGKN